MLDNIKLVLLLIAIETTIIYNFDESRKIQLEITLMQDNSKLVILLMQYRIQFVMTLPQEGEYSF